MISFDRTTPLGRLVWKWKNNHNDWMMGQISSRMCFYDTWCGNESETGEKAKTKKWRNMRKSKSRLDIVGHMILDEMI